MITLFKDLATVNSDLSSVFILDNSPGAYRHYVENAVPIKSWFSVSIKSGLGNLFTKNRLSYRFSRSKSRQVTRQGFLREEYGTGNHNKVLK
jgi:TFIIF-interacting CTD phosphatase-like protein